MQYEICCANLIGRSWRTWKTNQIAPTYLTLEVRVRMAWRTQKGFPRILSWNKLHDTSQVSSTFWTSFEGVQCIAEKYIVDSIFGGDQLTSLTLVDKSSMLYLSCQRPCHMDRLRVTSHTSQEPQPWSCESPKESVQRPSQNTSKIM